MSMSNSQLLLERLQSPAFRPIDMLVLTKHSFDSRSFSGG